MDEKQIHFADDDFIDRLNNRITIMGISYMYFYYYRKYLCGKPINCWTPGRFI